MSAGTDIVPGMTDDGQARIHAMIDELLGVPDEAANRSVDVIHAQAEALAWVYEVTGTYPAPRHVAEALNRVAWPMRRGEDLREPSAVLLQVAADALAS
jgi:hypothetical protein